MTTSSPTEARVGPEGGKAFRRAFTLVELLIALVVFMAVAAVGLELWTGSARQFAKGEDTLTTTQEASNVILHLRRDLSGLAVPKPADQYLLRYEKVGGGLIIKEDVFFDRPGRKLAKKQYRNDSTGYGGGSSDRLMLQFHVFTDAPDETEEVVWTYRPSALAITRKVGDRPEQTFAVPRLKDFDLQMMYQLQDTQAMLEGLGWSSFNDGVLQQLWFRVRFMVKAQDTAGGVETTRIEMESAIFPKHLHRILRSSWLDREAAR